MSKNRKRRKRRVFDGRFGGVQIKEKFDYSPGGAIVPKSIVDSKSIIIPGEATTKSGVGVMVTGKHSGVMVADKKTDTVTRKGKKRNRKKKAIIYEGFASYPKAELRFTPFAWAKMKFLVRIAEGEVGGFCISDEKDLLLVKDIFLPKQEVGGADVEFDDVSVADFFEDKVDEGLRPEHFARIWFHSHPFGLQDPSPSGVDEATFKRAFGGSDWAIMFIASKGGTYARLSLRVGLKMELELPVTVDYNQWHSMPTAKALEKWRQEYEANVTFIPAMVVPGVVGFAGIAAINDALAQQDDFG